jgi:hypothetical protein
MGGKATDDAANTDSEQSIGRPLEWGEERYEKPGTTIEQSVLKKPGEVAPDTKSTTVTEEDYE